MISQSNLTPEQSINLLEQVCEQYRATAQEHVLLQEALKTVRNLVIEPPGGHYREDAKRGGDVEATRS